MSRKRKCKSQTSTAMNNQKPNQPKSPVKLTNEDTPGSDVSSLNDDDYRDIMELLGESEVEGYDDKPPQWIPTKDELDPAEAQRMKYTGTPISKLFHVKDINANRKVLLDHIKYPFFDTLFPGCLTSIRSKNSVDGHTICEIAKVKRIGHSYEVDGVMTDKVLSLKIGNRFYYYQLTAISNFEWTEGMVNEYRTREAKSKTVITHGWVMHKRTRLCNAKAYILAEKAQIEAKKLQGAADDLNSCLDHARDKPKGAQMCLYCTVAGPSNHRCPGLRQ